MTPFLESTSFRRLSAHEWEGLLEEDWLQGRGAFGGWSMAAGTRAMQALAGDLGRPLALQAHFSAPTKPGPVTMKTAVARRGRRVVTLTASLHQGDTTTTVLSMTWGAAVEGKVSYYDDVSKEAPAYSSIEPAPWMPPMPAFLQHFDVRFTGGNIPYSGGEQAHIQGWIGLKDADRTPYDAALVGAIADVFPPGALTRAKNVTGAASVSLQISFAADLTKISLPETSPLLVDARSHWSEDGYSEDLTSVWGPDGRLIARGHQLVALL